jgi:hypothetical protein
VLLTSADVSRRVACIHHSQSFGMRIARSRLEQLVHPSLRIVGSPRGLASSLVFPKVGVAPAIMERQSLMPLVAPLP